MKRTSKKSVPAYITAASPKARPMLRLLRGAIKTAAPAAEEKISYGIPYYSHHGRLIYFAAFTNHVSLYVMGASKKLFAKEIQKYQSSKATLRFPIGTRVPVLLVKKLVKARVKELEAKTK